MVHNIPRVFDKLKIMKVASFCAKEMQLLRSKPWSKSTIMKVKYRTKKLLSLVKQTQNSSGNISRLYPFTYRYINEKKIQYDVVSFTYALT